MANTTLTVSEPVLVVGGASHIRIESIRNNPTDIFCLRLPLTSLTSLPAYSFPEAWTSNVVSMELVCRRSRRSQLLACVRKPQLLQTAASLSHTTFASHDLPSLAAIARVRPYGA